VTRAGWRLDRLSGDPPSANDAEGDDRNREQQRGHGPEERDAAEYRPKGGESRAEPRASIEKLDARDNEYREESQRDEEQRLVRAGAVRVRCLGDADRDKGTRVEPLRERLGARG
jgi:hypothetical protein